MCVSLRLAAFGASADSDAFPFSFFYLSFFLSLPLFPSFAPFLRTVIPALCPSLVCLPQMDPTFFQCQAVRVLLGQGAGGREAGRARVCGWSHIDGHRLDSCLVIKHVVFHSRPTNCHHQFVHTCPLAYIGTVGLRWGGPANAVVRVCHPVFWAARDGPGAMRRSEAARQS